MDARIYSIYDVKTGMYGPAMTFVSDGTAIRSFQEMMIENKGQSLLSLYPSDYILFCLGLFHQDTGIIEPLPAPMNILSGGEAFTRACVEANNRRARAAQLSGQQELDSDTYPASPELSEQVKITKNITSEEIQENLKKYD